MPASSSNAGPSQFNAPQFGGPEVHPEFGYLAPTVRLRRKFALVLEGVACGVLVGAIAMFFATMEREEEKASAMLATPMLVTPMPVTPMSSAATSSAATPASPKASAPTASGSAAMASTPGASGSVPTAPAASTKPALKPGSSTPASATSTPPQTAAVRGFAAGTLRSGIVRIACGYAQASSGPQRYAAGCYGRRICICVRPAAGCASDRADVLGCRRARIRGCRRAGIRAGDQSGGRQAQKEGRPRAASYPARAGAAHRLRQPVPAFRGAAGAGILSSALRLRLLAVTFFLLIRRRGIALP